MTNPDDRRVRLSDDLHDAVANGEIVAFFQTQFSLITGKVVAAEALSRWRHPVLGMISPEEFIPLAEEHHLIHGIGERMLRLGCEAAAEWQRLGHPIEIAVNVSLLQLESRALEQQVADLLSELDIDAALLTLEITETTAIADVPFAINTLHALRDTGVGVSIDDFGSENSSIHQVESLPATELKLDQTLIRDIASGSRERLDDAVRFGKHRGLRLVAEGVETAKQLERVIALKCDRVQGFRFSRPLALPFIHEQVSLT